MKSLKQISITKKLNSLLKNEFSLKMSVIKKDKPNNKEENTELNKEISNNTLISNNKITFHDRIYVNDITGEIKNMTRIHKLNKRNHNKNQKMSPFVESSLLSKSQLIKKYIFSKEYNEIANILRGDLIENSKEYNILKEENEKKDLIEFIKNCITYRKDHYLQSISFFNNRIIRNYMLNKDNLEIEFNKNNPNTKHIQLLSNMSLKKRYEEVLNKFKSPTEIPSFLETQYDEVKYEYFNTISEYKTIQEQAKIKENMTHNQKLINILKENRLCTNENNDNLVINEVTKSISLAETLSVKEFQNNLKKSNKISISEEQLEADRLESKKDDIILTLIHTKDYPGSKNGPNPQDNFEHYLTWLKVNFPKEVVDAFQRKIDRQIKLKETLFENEKDSDDIINDSSVNLPLDERDLDSLIRNVELGIPIQSQFIPPRSDCYSDDFLHGSDPLEQYQCLQDEEDMEKYEEEEIHEAWHYTKFDQFEIFPKIPPRMNFKHMKMVDELFKWNKMANQKEIPRHLGWENSNIHSIIKFDERIFLNDNIFFKDLLKKNVHSRSLSTLVELYPDEVKYNKSVGDFVQVYTKKKPYKLFEHVHYIIDYLAVTLIDIQPEEKKLTLGIMESFYPYPRSTKNLRKFLSLNWNKTEIVPGPDYFSIKDGDAYEIFYQGINYEITADTEEEEAKEKKRQESRDKREMEEAKAAGKEAFEEYKKKKEDEEKQRLEEEEKKEQEEYEKYLAEQEEKEKQLEKEMKEVRPEDFEEEEKDIDGGIKTIEIPDDELDLNVIKDPDDIFGEDKKRKYLVEGGLPKINKNNFNKSPERMRYIELYDKMQKLICSKEEESELIELLKTKKTNPKLYSEITGISIEEISYEEELKKTFSETYFKKDSNINLSEAELALIEREVANIGNRSKSEDQSEGSYIENLEPEDFYTPPIPNYDKPINPHHNIIPYDFYDNEDGFWDDYIKEKRESFDLSNVKMKPYSAFDKYLMRKENNIKH